MTLRDPSVVWMLDVDMNAQMNQYSGSMNTDFVDAYSQRQPRLRRDDDLLKRGFLKQARVDFLALRAEVMTPEQIAALYAKDKKGKKKGKKGGKSKKGKAKAAKGGKAAKAGKNKKKSKGGKKGAAGVAAATAEAEALAVSAGGGEDDDDSGEDCEDAAGSDAGGDGDAATADGSEGDKDNDGDDDKGDDDGDGDKSSAHGSPYNANATGADDSDTGGDGGTPSKPKNASAPVAGATPTALGAGLSSPDLRPVTPGALASTDGSEDSPSQKGAAITRQVRTTSITFTTIQRTTLSITPHTTHTKHHHTCKTDHQPAEFEEERALEEGGDSSGEPCGRYRPLGR